MTAPLLRATGLERRYGAHTVVDGVDLEVREGEVLAVLGPNGAGKSTLFRLLLLLEGPDDGAVEVSGRAVRPGAPEARRLAGLFQRPVLFAGSVVANVEYGLRARGVGRSERRRRAASVLEALGLAPLAGAAVGTLSGGEAQRVALARALVLEPDVLLLDEPTAGLDVMVRRRFRHELEALLRSRARSAVLITHDAADAFALADRIAVMEEGRLVQVGTPTELVVAPATPFVAEFTGAELLLDGVVEESREGVVTVRVAADTRLVAAAEPWAPVPVPGARAHVAYRPEDVMLAPAEGAGTSSARNDVPATVAALTPAGGLVRVRLGGPLPLTALLTREGADALGLAPGARVVARIKATALRAYPAAPLRPEAPPG